MHINAMGGIEPCGILHYSDKAVRTGKPIEVSISESKVIQEIRSLYTSSTSCPLIDRPTELLEIVKKVFPETYHTFTDFKYLEGYAELCKSRENTVSVTNAVKADLYTHLSEYIFRSMHLPN
jgi:hypothetical protein